MLPVLFLQGAGQAVPSYCLSLPFLVSPSHRDPFVAGDLLGTSGVCALLTQPPFQRTVLQPSSPTGRDLGRASEEMPRVQAPVTGGERGPPGKLGGPESSLA